MADTRTAPAVAKLVDAIQEDIQEARSHLDRGLAVLRALEPSARGINGLAAYLKAQGNALDEMLAGLESEAKNVETKMLGGSRPEIVTNVDAAQLEAVRAAKAAS